MGQVVLVTGVAGDLARRLMAQLSRSPAIERVIGVDVVPPRGDLADAHFVRADIRNPVIAKVIVRERVDTVVHTSVTSTPAATGGRTTTKELNVIGTMQLLAACQQAPDLRKLVLKSSAAFYGASNRDPAMFTEDMSAKRLPGGGFAKDVNEVESYTRGFARRRPDVGVTTLRMANVIGPEITTAMTGYFRLPVVPTVLGFNPRMQFVHEYDALGVLEHATRSEVTGTYNVAGDGVITLSQAIRRAGRPFLPMPAFAVPGFGSAFRNGRVADFSPEHVRFLTFGRGLDTTRMRGMLGFEPTFTTARAFGDFAATLHPGGAPERFRAAESALVSALSPTGEVVLMGDAEIIPIGTRGRPGRGTGETRPSANSRSLATQKTVQKRDQKTGQKPAVKTSQQPGRPPVAESGHEPVQFDIPAQISPARDAREDVQPAAADPAAGSATVLASESRPPITADHRHRGPGIASAEWLSALTSASKELFGDDWETRLAQFLAFLRRRLTGDYTVDDYGFDREVTERFLLAAMRPVAQKWFRIEVRGAENIPTVGGALVVSNHSGTIPIDGMMTAVSIRDHTGRFLRPLGADLVFKLPVIGDLARKGGATLACNEDAERMLRGGELVGVWPEGFKGIGKPFSERYKLQRFGRGGFVSAAIRTGVPIIPTSVVGAEEIYPLVGNIPSLARLLGIPYLPITPLFPLLGPLGLIPLPSKWLIEFGEPIRTDDYDVGAADDPMLVFNVTDQVRESIQQTLYTLLMRRKSVFS